MRLNGRRGDPHPLTLAEDVLDVIDRRWHTPRASAAACREREAAACVVAFGLASPKARPRMMAAAKRSDPETPEACAALAPRPMASLPPPACPRGTPAAPCSPACPRSLTAALQEPPSSGDRAILPAGLRQSRHTREEA